jgi:hypothetical protein
MMAGKTSSERVSVKGYLVPYLQEVGLQIGTDDLSEVVNHLLVCQKLGCFGLPQAPIWTEIPRQSQSQLIANQPVLDDATLADEFSNLLAA